MKHLLLATAFVAAILGQVAAQLTLKVTSIPSNTPAGAEIFVAGSFQNWQPGDPAFKLTSQGNGTFSIVINPPVGTVEFKFTRGAWASVEGNASGSFLPNRTTTYSGQPKTVELQILSWEDLGGATGNHTNTWNTAILDNEFFMPQLNRKRRIWLYLPPDYQTSTKKYPVLYMQDGQNLFDDFYSFSGEWGVDESLNKLFTEGDYGCIVVGIDNGEAERLNEYSPWVNPNYGGGDGEKYLAFLAETLKPYIDSNYRTRPEAWHTGIAGSSMGANISMFGGVEQPDVFGKAGIFSPAFWFSDSCYSHVTTTGKKGELRTYFVAGTNESTTMISNMQKMHSKLLAIGQPASEMVFKSDGDGQHSEWYWKREFPAAYKFLFANTPNATGEPGDQTAFEIFPNPAHGLLWVKGGLPGVRYEALIFSADGRHLKKSAFTTGESISTDSIPAGNHFLRILDGQKQVANLPFVLID